MKDEERQALVKDLINYVAAMAPHQRDRMGGKLILRSLDALKKIRVLEMTEPEHCAKLLAKEVVT